MFSWPALLLAPAVALAELSLVYAMVTPSCARQDRSGLHWVAGVCVLVVLGLTLMAWQAWRRARQAPVHAPPLREQTPRAVTAADGDSAAQRPNFVALMAVLVGGLSALVCGALWLPIWMLSPCY
jgi:hypothetical protein